MPLAVKLRQARQESGLTQQKAAELSGLEPNTIWRYEAGQREPSASTLNVLASLYVKPVEWFFEDEPESPPLTEEEQGELEADRELVMNEASVALRSASPNPSDEAIRSIAAFIRFVNEEETREREEQERSKS